MDRLQPAPHPCAQLRALAALLDEDAIDTALQAGLMDLQITNHCQQCSHAARRVAAEQARLRGNWAARARYQARSLRLQRRAAERQARRAPAPLAPAVSAAATPAPPSLPPAVAAALARAKARAAGTPRT